MAAQKGKALLLKIGDGGAPETFTTVAGMRAQSVSLNSQTIETTHAESAGEWRELLAGSGVKTASLSGSGIFKTDTVDETVRAAFFNQTNDNWQIVLPGFGSVEGPFRITNLDYAGEYNGEMTYAMALESAGELTFTPSP